MTPTIIVGWPLLILALAVYRVTRLIVVDSFPPVAWVREKWLNRWPMVGETVKYPSRRLIEKHQDGKIELIHLGNNVYEVKKGTTLGYLISCVWCSGFWVALAFVLAYWAWPVVTLQVASVFAVAAIGSYIYNQEK